MFTTLFATLLTLSGFVNEQTEPPPLDSFSVSMSKCLIEKIVQKRVSSRVADAVSNYQSVANIDIGDVHTRLTLKHSQTGAAGTLRIDGEAQASGTKRILGHNPYYTARLAGELDIHFVILGDRIDLRTVDFRHSRPIVSVWRENGNYASLLSKSANRRTDSFALDERLIKKDVYESVAAMNEVVSCYPVLRRILLAGNWSSSDSHLTCAANCQIDPPTSDVRLLLSEALLNRSMPRRLPLPDLVKARIGSICSHYSVNFEFRAGATKLKLSLWRNDQILDKDPLCSISQQLEIRPEGDAWALERVGNLEILLDAKCSVDDQQSLKSLGSLPPLLIRFTTISNLLQQLESHVCNGSTSSPTYAMFLAPCRQFQDTLKSLALDFRIDGEVVGGQMFDLSMNLIK